MKRFALKRLTALVLAFIMTLSLLPMNVWAEELQENAEEQVIVAAEEKEESPAEVAEEPAEDSSAVVEESAEEPVVEEETESSETEDVSASAGISVPLANSAASAYEARWGLATGENADQAPTEWTNGALAEAMTYANGLESGTAYIRLLSDVDTSAPLEFASGKTTVLDLNGHDIDRGLTTATENGNVIKVSGNLTLCDTSANAATAPGKITGGAGYGYSYAIQNGRVYHTDCGGVYVGYGSTFVMNGGSISGNRARSRDGTNASGGVYVGYGGTFVMNDGTISGNTATEDGGGVYVDANGTFTMIGGSICGNTAKSGGGVYVDGTFTMYDGSISKNNTTSTASQGGGGGGVYVDDGTFTMQGGVISQNDALNNGGGVYVGYGSTFVMNGGFINGNIANSSGGGVYCYDTVNDGSWFKMTGGVISGNTASNNGGGVYMDTGSKIQVSGTPVISGNVKGGTLNSDTGLYELGENGSVNNVQTGGTKKIAVVGTLKDGASICVSKTPPSDGSPLTIATGSEYTLTESDVEKFSGNSGYICVLSENNEVQLRSETAAFLVGPSTLASGYEATLTFRITGRNVTAVEATLDYDASTLELLSYSGLPSGWTANIVGSKITLSGASNPITSYAADMMTLLFRIKSGISNGTAQNISLKDITFYNGNGSTRVADATLSSTVINAAARWGLATGENNDRLPTVWLNYGTLSNALSYANGQTSGTVYIQLLKDTSSTRISFASCTSTVLDLNGFDLKLYSDGSGADGPFIYVKGNLTLCDTSVSANDEPGKITGCHSTYSGGGVRVDGTFTMNGGVISGNTTREKGGGVWVDKGTFTMNSGNITGNTAWGDGGGVYVSGGVFTMNGGSIYSNNYHALNRGGGVYVAGGSFVMNGGSISESTADYGGGVYVNGGNFTMAGGSISENTASSGGGVSINAGSFTMSGGTISGNNATNIGGGVYATANATMNVSGAPCVFGNVRGGTLNSATGLYDNGTTNNVYLLSKKTITVVDALKNGARVGATTEIAPTSDAPVSVVVGTATYALSQGDVDKFFSDDTYSVTLDSTSNKAELEVVSATILGSSTVAAGREVTLTLNVSGSNATSVTAKLDYDDSQLELLRYNSLRSGWNVNRSDSVFTVSGSNILTGSGADVLSVTFLVKEGVTTGTSLEASFDNVILKNEKKSLSAGSASWQGCVGAVSTTGKNFVQIDDEVTLRLNVTGQNIAEIETTLDYDANTLELLRYSSAAGWTVNLNESKFTLSSVSTPLSSSGAVLLVTLRLKDGVAAGAELKATFKDVTLSSGDSTINLGDTSWKASAVLLRVSGSNTVAVGGIVKLTLNVSGQNITGFVSKLAYNTTVLEYYDCSSEMDNWSVSCDGSTLTMSGKDNPINSATDVVTLRFRIKSGAPIGTALRVSLEDIILSAESSSGETEGVSWSGIVSQEARWGIAAGADNDQAPTTWVGSGKLTEAVSYANSYSSSTTYIQLLTDVNTTSVLTFSNGKDILDLNGKTIDRGLTTATTNGNVITVKGNLTLCDTSTADVSKQGRITGGYNYNWGGGGVIVSSGTFTINGGSISRNRVAGESMSVGGGVFLQNGGFCMNGGTICGNVVYDGGFGGGVYALFDASSFVMNGGTISGNEAESGGGVFTEIFFWMKGGSICENTAEIGGGVTFINPTYSSFEMDGGSIHKNTATKFGGGVCAFSAPFMMTGGSISANTAQSGGGVYTSGSFSMTGGVITGNNATVRGGGLSLVSEDMLVKGTPIISGNVRNGTFDSATGVYVLGARGSVDNAEISANFLVVGELNEGASIGVSRFLYPSEQNQTIFTIASGYGYTLTESDAAKFTSDGDLVLAFDQANNKLMLMKRAASLRGSSNTSAGSEVTVVLSVVGRNITDVEATLDYDSSVLELLDYSSLCDGWTVTKSGDEFTLSGADSPASSIADVLAVTFRVKRSIPTGTALNASFKNIVITDDGNNYNLDDASWNSSVIAPPQAQWGIATGTNNDEKPIAWVGCGTLASAVSYANSLSTGTAYIQLLKHVGTTTYIEFNSGKKTVLDLNGYTIDRGLSSARTDGVVIIVGGKLTLCDTSSNKIEEQGEITGGYIEGGGGGIWVQDYATLIMNGGVITENTAIGGGGVWIEDSGTFVMNGGAISWNYARTGGGVFLGNNTSFIMNGGVISWNVAEGLGAGVCSNDAITVNGGSISWNIALESGGGVVCTTLTMNGGDVSENRCGFSGGGVEVFEDFQMTGGSICKNTAEFSGAGAHVGGNFLMTGGTISGNNFAGETNMGGGVYCSGDFTMGGGTISGNTAGAGGGVHASGAFVMEDGVISGNNATAFGGGVVFADTAEFSGTPFIFGNVLKGTLNSKTGLYEKGRSGSDNNVDLSTGEYFTIVDSLEEGAAIGVTVVTKEGDLTPPTVARPSERPRYHITVDDAVKIIGDDGRVGMLNSADNTVQLQKATPHMITFDMQGRGSQVRNQTVMYGKTVIEPKEPTAKNYLFCGWYTEAECISEWDFDTVITEDVTLYAKWRINQFCGADVTWELIDGGTLFISGTGAINNYTSATTVPYAKFAKDIEKIVVDEGVTDIGNWAFSGLVSLTNVELPNTVKAIGNNAFYGCRTLENIAIPANVETVSNVAFWNCSALTSIEVDSANKTFSSIDGALYSNYGTDDLYLVKCPEGYVGALKIAADTVSINTAAIVNCTNLTSVSIPAAALDKNTAILEDNFYGCEDLMAFAVTGVSTLADTSYYVSEGALYKQYHLREADGSLTVRNCLLRYPCGNNGEFTVPASCNEIGSYAFYGCTGLSAVVFEGLPPVIADNAFYGVLVNAFYMVGNYEAWSEEVLQNYGGQLTWSAKCDGVNHISRTNEKWDSDIEHHWKECFCGLVLASGEHEFGNDNRCDVCDFIPDGLWCAEIPEQVYTGKAIKPEIEVYYRDILLASNKDYSISYKNNTNAASADAVDAKGKDIAPQIIIKGKGAYVGTLIKTFTILPVDLNDEQITVAGVTAPFTGKATYPKVTVSYSGKKLSAKDYVVSYPDTHDVKTPYLDVGTWTIRLEGTGNYTSTRNVEFSIICTPITKVAIEPKTASMIKGEHLRLATVVTPVDTDDFVYWASSDVSIATVDQDGLVTAHGAGKVKITATSGSGKSATCSITVGVLADAVAFNSVKTTSLAVGKTVTLSAKAFCEDGTKPVSTAVQYEVVEGKSYATIDAKGKLTGLGVGEVVVRATAVNGTAYAYDEITINVCVPITKVVLDLKSATMVVDEKLQLTVTTAPDDHSDTISWKSSDDTIAIVDQDGLVTAHGAGKVKITATSGSGKSATCSITVGVPADAVAFNSVKTTSLAVGKTMTLSAKAYREDGTKPVSTAVQYEVVEGKAYATIDAKGKLTGLGVGEVVVRATAVNGTAYAYDEITINVCVPITKVVLDLKSATMVVDEKLQLNVTATPDDHSDTISWKSSDDTIATVNDDGSVTAHRVGKVKITATSGSGKSATCPITVGVPADAVAFNSVKTTSLAVGKTMTLSAKAYREDGAKPVSTAVQYEIVEGKAYATIDAKGKLTGLGVGEVVVRATAVNGTAYAYDEITINVCIPITKLVVDQKTAEVPAERTLQLTATATPYDHSDTITWTSSDERIATVNKFTGTVTGVREGKVKITATSGSGKSSYCTVTVLPAPIHFSGYDDDVITGIDLPAGEYYVETHHTGRSNFIVYFHYGYDKNDYMLVANGVGNCSGQRFMDDTRNIPVRDGMLEIKADGNWTIDIVPITERTTTNIRGYGDVVTGKFTVTGSRNVFTVTHDGDSNFIVYAYYGNGESDYDLFANEVGSFSGRALLDVPAGKECFFAIKADGNWTIDLGKGDPVTVYP